MSRPSRSLGARIKKLSAISFIHERSTRAEASPVDHSAVEVPVTPPTIVATSFSVVRGPVAAPNFLNPMRMVTVILGSGDDIKEYALHEDVAIFHSPALRGAFRGPFSEGATKKIVLEDFDFPDIFGYLQSWMYLGKLWRPTPEIHPLIYVKVWILADRLLMPELQNHVAAAIVKQSWNETSIFDLAVWIYEHTSFDSPLRQLYVDKIAHGMGVCGWYAFMSTGKMYPLLAADVCRSLHMGPGGCPLRIRDTVLRVGDYLIPQSQVAT